MNPYANSFVPQKSHSKVGYHRICIDLNHKNTSVRERSDTGHTLTKLDPLAKSFVPQKSLIPYVHVKLKNDALETSTLNDYSRLIHMTGALGNIIMRVIYLFQ